MKDHPDDRPLLFWKHLHLILKVALKEVLHCTALKYVDSLCNNFAVHNDWPWQNGQSDAKITPVVAVLIMADPTLSKPYWKLDSKLLKKINNTPTTEKEKKKEKKKKKEIATNFCVHDSPAQHDTLQCQIWLQKVEWFRRDLLDKAQTCEHKQTDGHTDTMIQYTHPLHYKASAYL